MNFISKGKLFSISMRKKKLKGMTWDHSRGYTPMIATSQRFCEMHPDIEITWEKRSLQDFADKPVTRLAAAYDLLVIDHPWIGLAAEQDIILPLDQYLPPSFIQELKNNSIGPSYNSYSYNDSQWALPIDAAAPVAAYRPDLLNNLKMTLPKTYDQLLDMAAKGHVIFPAVSIDTLMNFYMFCSSLGENPFLSKKSVISKKIGTRALQLLKQLTARVDKRCFEWNPIMVYERMTQTDEFVYCPFAYGYSNYSREGYSRTRLNFHDMVLLDNTKLKSTIGGAGIAVSSKTTQVSAAMEYLQYVSSGECQRTLYFDTGGQPAHYMAWNDYYTNFKCGGFFTAMFPALKRAYLRPRYNGYTHFQDQAGDVIGHFLMNGGKEKDVLNTLNILYQDSIL